MNAATRLIILLGCFASCAGGLISASRERLEGIDVEAQRDFGSNAFSNYQLAASDKFSFNQLEATIRADAVAKSPHARIEFGSVKIEHGALVAQVLFFGPDREMQAFLYNLVPEQKSWKIARVQRLWFVPRSQLLRGLQV